MTIGKSQSLPSKIRCSCKSNRMGDYHKPKFSAHPKDCSVMVYSGHAVYRTLIRCHFSPTESTGAQYIYSGSADGKIHARPAPIVSCSITYHVIFRRFGRLMGKLLKFWTASRLCLWSWILPRLIPLGNYIGNRDEYA